MFDLKEFRVFVYLKLLTINYIRMKKIALTGIIGSGKTTAATFFKDLAAIP